MANAFLKRKWRKTFDAYDISKDKKITIEDADIFSGNILKYYKFDGARAAQVKADARKYWKNWVLKGHTSADEKTLVANMEKAYLADKAKFRKDARKLFSLIVNIWDVNKDGMLSEEEFVAIAKCTGFKNFNENYMKGWPQVKPGYISLEVYMDAFVEYNCNDDINNIEKEKPRYYGMGILDPTQDM